MMPNIIPSSVGALIVASIALCIGIFQFIVSIKIEKETWSRWGSVISFIVVLHGLAVFFQFHLAYYSDQDYKKKVDEIIEFSRGITDGLN